VLQAAAVRAAAPPAAPLAAACAARGVAADLQARVRVRLRVTVRLRLRLRLRVRVRIRVRVWVRVRVRVRVRVGRADLEVGARCCGGGRVEAAHAHNAVLAEVAEEEVLHEHGEAQPTVVRPELVPCVVEGVPKMAGALRAL